MRKIQIHNLDLHRKTLDLVMDKAVKVLSSFNAMEQWKLCPQPAGVCVCVCVNIPLSPWLWFCMALIICTHPVKGCSRAGVDAGGSDCIVYFSGC